ncbi:MAG: hypothetical protein DI565_02750 [Ancylobacter novellus]|uniref:NAD-dependent epimerase/dehydratase domain-containing protein n=1 Tax=Ancylobacter novellus TaxID=921 RepID=A0A2W5KQH4_ANCNO|nr:MAG: hypothetical protein DI565_02750 [Ancylobacter novellus]
MSRKILVTGSAGLVGRATATRLAESGFQVRAGLRRTAPPVSFAGHPAIEPTPCDLDDAAQLRAAVAGADLVVHAAYGDEAAMAAQCRRLLSAMEQEGVARLVQLSSIAVYGERTGLIVETDGPAGDPGPYGRAKLDCEEAIRRWGAAASGRAAVLLRPGVVYGRGSALWVDKMVERIEAGALGDLGEAASGPAPLVHVDDVAAAIEAATRLLLESGDGVSAVNLVGPETPPWRDYFAALASAAGAPAPRPASPVEAAARRALALPAKAWARLGLPGFRSLALAPAPGEQALFARDAVFSMERAALGLGFRPMIGLAEGLARTFGPAQPNR